MALSKETMTDDRLNLHRVDTSQVTDGRAIHVPGEFEQRIDFTEPDDGRPLTILEYVFISAIGLTVLATVAGLVIAIASFRG